LSEEYDYDLVVVGGGPAGASAAFTAAKKGIKVALLEKELYLKKKTRLQRQLEPVELHGFKILKNLEFQTIVSIQSRIFHFVHQTTKSQLVMLFQGLQCWM
jgi:flavin-dependent dehydrogenase